MAVYTICFIQFIRNSELMPRHFSALPECIWVRVLLQFLRGRLINYNKTLYCTSKLSVTECLNCSNLKVIFFFVENNGIFLPSITVWCLQQTMGYVHFYGYNVLVMQITDIIKLLRIATIFAKETSNLFYLLSISRKPNWISS